MVSRLVQHNGSRIVLAELPRKRQRQLPAVTQRDLRHAIVLMVRLGGKQVRLKEKRAVARVTDTQVLSKRARIPWFRLDATKAKGKLMAMKATAAATAAKPNNFAAAAAAAAAAEAGEAETAAKVK